jgi:hypothetical protein
MKDKIMKPSEDFKLKTDLSQCLMVLEEMNEDREYSIETIVAVFEKCGYRKVV